MLDLKEEQRLDFQARRDLAFAAGIAVWKD